MEQKKIIDASLLQTFPSLNCSAIKLSLNFLFPAFTNKISLVQLDHFSTYFDSFNSLGFLKISWQVVAYPLFAIKTKIKEFAKKILELRTTVLAWGARPLVKDP